MIPGEFGSSLINHLWQSTVVVAIAWLLTLALRKNHARVRYWVWMAASIKFLLPFSVLMAAGEWARSLMPATPVARPAVASAMEQVVQPFAGMQIFDAPPTVAVVHHGLLSAGNWWLVALFVVWACGVLVVASRFGQGWWKVYAAMRAASWLGEVQASEAFETGNPSGAKAHEILNSLIGTTEVVPFQNGGALGELSGLAADVPVLMSPSLIEPGIFGIFRPVLLMPEGILERLSPEQMRAIVAHEMCHVRRRDNLTFAIHMIVETLFWFHPAVWWIGARLVEERERACDEAVLQLGSGAETYAESILNVCKFYVESPLESVAGVSGSDLKKRIFRIMARHAGLRMSLSRKLLLGAVGLVALTAPIVFGLAQTREEMPDWQKRAGGAMEFEVASVKENKGDNPPQYTNFSLGPGEVFRPVGGLFRAVDRPLIVYIGFAYKLPGSQADLLAEQLPGWATTDRFDIEAHADGSPTKDQMRVMMQALLRERFHFAYHYEARELPVFVLEVARPGKLGPELRPHPAGSPCSNESPRGQAGRVSSPSNSPGTPSDEFPPICGGISGMSPRIQGCMAMGARDIPIKLFADSIAELGNLGRPVVDRTGLAGTYDFRLDWMPQNNGPEPPGVNPALDNSGPSIITAMKEQMGLKLEAQKGQVDVFVVDRIEYPTPN